jgi:hypothetical protein
MAQINVSVEDRVLAALDQVAQAKALSRPELLRRVIQELIEAHDAGRVVFQKEAAPRLDTTVSFLVHELRDLVVELDRAQNENARLFGKLVADWNGGEAASQRAHESIANQIRQRNSEAYSAFYQQVEKLLVGFEMLEPKLAEALEPRLVQISEQLAQSIKLAGEPRQIRAVYLGDDRMLSLRFLSTCGGLAIVIGLLLGLMAPGLRDNWSVFHAARLIDSPAEMCRLIQAEYATTDCTVPQQERELGLRVIAHEDRR